MRILDVCCGGKMFYFNPDSPLVTFMDIREGSGSTIYTER